MPPPADSPVTKTREGSDPYRASAVSTICLTEAASPLPRVSFVASNQLKQDRLLLAAPVCGNTTAKPHWSANFCQPEWA